ncbi:hypothetical protein [Longimicrobium terrae]|uniref:Uncharacterized protein n=1 Tax=Longimicrobium terrae TaxID=1639882 RepID=A0A841H4X0_9BACT|nr:hypothetical protein [Longimicrobium terrae]MBB4638785.1 hypothetical protein [Longimicrobium terrae]MBB6073024.1 hypothetical protein [Longimicrobium terrae]NNC33147.1 hypothetical protein [Longimicrobium terrae]
MDELRIDAVAMVRAIRDAHYEMLKDATQEERIRFFHEESAKFRAEMAERRLAGRHARDGN